MSAPQAAWPAPGVCEPGRIKLSASERADLKRQIKLREQQLCNPGLERDERIAIGRQYCELRDMEDACV